MKEASNQKIQEKKSSQNSKIQRNTSVWNEFGKKVFRHCTLVYMLKCLPLGLKQKMKIKKMTNGGKTINDGWMKEDEQGEVWG